MFLCNLLHISQYPTWICNLFDFEFAALIVPMYLDTSAVIIAKVRSVMCKRCSGSRRVTDDAAKVSQALPCFDNNDKGHVSGEGDRFSFRRTSQTLVFDVL